MSAAVVRCDDLEVLDGTTTIPVQVFDANIWELNVPVLVRQLVRPGPLANFVCGSVGAAVAVSLSSIVGLQEPLVLAFQLVVEHDSPNLAPAILDAFRGTLIGSVKVRIVGNLGSSREAGVEPLAVALGPVLGGFQQVPAWVRERQECRS
jgi:hypothetical protein